MSRIKAINPFLITRFVSEKNSLVEKVFSQKIESANAQIHEYESLKKLVDILVLQGLDIKFLDGFNWSFQIPQISKEFDLLKVTNEYCLNIELKSQSVSVEKIHKQLIKNKYYLNSLKKKLLIFFCNY